MRIKIIIKNLCVAGLLIMSLISASSVFANINRNAQAPNLALYFSQILNVDAARNYKNITELNRVSAWLKEQMRLFGIPCEFQPFVINSLGYRNVICWINNKSVEKVVIGAHYDVFATHMGANNNASGVVATLEAARLLALQKNKFKQDIEFVFYALEEPPYFNTEYMGSYIHAKALKRQKTNVKAVFILDSVGYFDENFVQNYPMGLKWIYPQHANFIASIGHLSSAALAGQFCEAMQQRRRLECQRLVTPTFMQIADFSGYINYAKLDFPTVLISDTAYYRYPYYNTEQDRLDRINLQKMSYVIDGLVQTVLMQ